MNEPLKLIEGMKKLKILEKHIDRNTERIQMYSSTPSNEKPTFGNEHDQRKQVEELIQSNKDLLTEYLHLKQRVDMTNLTTDVTIGKRGFKLVDLLVLRRGLAKRMERTYHALSTDYADRRLSQMQRNIALQPGEKAPYAMRFYDEKDKFDNLQEWQTLQDEIEQRLEVINATTELVTI